MPNTMHNNSTPATSGFPETLRNSALIESGCASVGAVADNCTVAVGFKPTAATTAPLNAMDGHYLLTFRKIGSTVSAWKQGTQLVDYTGNIGTSYAEFLANLLTFYCGSDKGYYSRLVVAEQALDYSTFWEPSGVVSGLWVPKPFVCPTATRTLNAMIGGTAGGSYYNPSYPPSRAFDGGYTAPESGGNTVVLSSAHNFLTVTYDLGEGNEVACSELGMQAAIVDGGGSLTEHTPRDFTIEGSNDGTNWTVLVDQEYVTWAYEGEIKMWATNSTTAYRYYKWDITHAAASTGNIIYLGECLGLRDEEYTYGENGCHLNFDSAFALGKNMAGTNLYPYSEDLTVHFESDGVTVAATSFTEDSSTSADHRMRNGIWPVTGLTAGGKYTVSASVKRGNGSRNFAFLDYASGSSVWVYWDLDDGTVYSTDGDRFVDAGITAEEDGYYRVWVSLITNDGSISDRWYIVSDNNTTFYDGDGTSSLYMTRVQLEPGDLSPYVATDGSASDSWTISGTQTLDTPTNNYPVLNAMQPANGIALSNGNLTGTCAVDDWETELPTMYASRGKYYAECSVDTLITEHGVHFGVANPEFNEVVGYIGQDPQGWGFYFSTDDDRVRAFHNGIASTISGTGELIQGDILQLALDMDTGQVWFGKNNTWLRGDPEAGTDAAYANVDGACGFGLSMRRIGQVTTINYGATGFTYAPPAGFKAMCAANLPAPSVLNSSKVAAVVLRDGTGADNTKITLDFQPNWVNIKARNTGFDWRLFDTERGVLNTLETNTADAEFWHDRFLTSFDFDGYTMNDADTLNKAANTYLDLCLKAGPAQGFYQKAGIVHDGVNPTIITHNLGAPITFAIVKRYDTTGHWNMYHVALGPDHYIRFLAEAKSSQVANWWPVNTATQFAIPGSLGIGTYVAYLFTDSDIFKAFSYTGNGLADGPFVHLGGKPLSIPFLKNTGYAEEWLNLDTARSVYNPVNKFLEPDTSDSEFTGATGNALTFTSQGFKPIGAGGNANRAGDTFVGLAILESTKHSNAF